MPKKTASRSRQGLGQCTYTSPVLHRPCRDRARFTRKIGRIGTARLCPEHADRWDTNVSRWPELTDATRRQFVAS